MMRHQTISSRHTPDRLFVVGYSALAQRLESLKRERTPMPQASGSMPTQSPAQKNMKLKLKSVVHKPLPKQPDAHPTGGWQPDRAPPYHSMADRLEEFMQYIMQLGMMAHEYFSAEIDDLMFFGHEQLSIVCQIVASVLYTELAWFRGYPYTFPVIPPQLQSRVLWPDDCYLINCCSVG